MTHGGNTENTESLNEWQSLHEIVRGQVEEEAQRGRLKNNCQ